MDEQLTILGIMAEWKREYTALALMAQEMSRELQNHCKDEIHVEQGEIIGNALEHIWGTSNPNEVRQLLS